MKLWDIEIEKIPCGWEKLYKEALQKYPNGKYFEVILDDPKYKSGYFYNPVKLHDLIISDFNALKIIVTKIIREYGEIDFTLFLTKIIDIDAKLYHLLWY